MKYIRTKDNIFAVNGQVSNVDIYYKTIKGIKLADTIEELCDEFVCNNELYKKIEHRKMYEGDICVLVDYGGFCVNIQKGNQVYGAIWTNKGLIYVAKMNDKGELELLWFGFICM